METFVATHSIVRRIWGKSDTVLFIFAGAAAEFALNKAVDWLYFTGRLPADPLGRLFSTVRYARQIVFANKVDALKAIDKITSIHTAVETARDSTIPDWAYRDVLFLLIHYSIAAYELMEQKLTPAEKEDVYQVFLAIGTRMGLKALPPNYNAWLPVRDAHLQADLQKSAYTIDLYKQYKKHLGVVRYFFLLQVQVLVVPQHVKNLLGLHTTFGIKPVIFFYKWSRRWNGDRFIKAALLPRAYKKEIAALDIA
ncbi:MAG TPA: oxygenase MpaB family protein [Chitinophagaceae bacterium]|nr:oxygenase MpaB family protein [Chitinophagaceae bacterium]